MSLCHLTIFSMKTSSFLTLNQLENLFLIELIAYQCLIKKLIYLAYRTRPDIAFIMGQLSCHNFDLQIDHIYITM